MPAPTLARPNQATAPASTNQTATAANVQPMIPFTRAARKKSRQIQQVGPIALQAGALAQINPVQVPAAGYLRKITLDVIGTTAANAATVAFANDAPFNVLQQISLSAANGDSLINPIDGFTLAMVNKYGCHGGQSNDPLADPNFSKVTGVGAGLGGSFHFQLDIPVEYDPRDACGALPNMAANQSFLLQFFLNSTAQLYTTAPTTPPNVTVTMTMEYWAAPSGTNPSGVAQQTAPRANNVVSQLLTANPPVVPGTDQTFQLPNVGGTIRYLLFILRTAAGVRTSADWPTVFNLLVNNDLYSYKTKDNWLRQLARNYELNAGVNAVPTLNALDTGVYVYTDFMNDGSEGSELASSSANRDLQLVTGSGTALGVEAQNWGANASQLLVVTNSLRVPDPTAYYAPFGI